MTDDNPFTRTCDRCSADPWTRCRTSSGKPLHPATSVHAARRRPLPANRPNLTPQPNRPDRTL